MESNGASSVTINAPDAVEDRPKALMVVPPVQGGEDGSSPSVVATGLLQHEAKLTVLNFGVKKASSYNETLPSKAQLLLVTGVR